MEHITGVTPCRADQFQEQERRVGLSSLDDDSRFAVSLIPSLSHVQDVRPRLKAVRGELCQSLAVHKHQPHVWTKREEKSLLVDVEETSS